MDQTPADGRDGGGRPAKSVPSPVVTLTPAMRERMKRLRERQRLSTQEVAEALGVTRQYVWQLESGYASTARARVVDKLAQALGWKDHAALFASEALDPPANEVTSIRVRMAAGARRRQLTEEEVYADDSPEAAWRRAGVMPVVEGGDDQFYMVPLVGRVSAGSGRSGAYTLVEGYVPIYSKDRDGRDMIAVTVTGTCMMPKLSEGDTALCIKVTDPRQVQSGSMCVVTLLDEGDGENDGGNVKYVEWMSAMVRLRAEDGTEKVVPRHRLRVEGRVWRVIREFE